jgi:mono/diheme cytochrome c family protein
MHRAITYLFLLFVIWSCGRDNNHPGYEYLPDMNYSVAKESYAPKEDSTGFDAMMEPVEGTVPRHMIPYQFKKTKKDRIEAGETFVNPTDSTEKVIQEGKEFFTLICQQCHGEKGDGKGFLFTEKYFPYPPANLIREAMWTVPDGEIFHVISVGYNLMGAHASMIEQEDRWKVVRYVRVLQQQAGR